MLSRSNLYQLGTTDLKQCRNTCIERISREGMCTHAILLMRPVLLFSANASLLSPSHGFGHVVPQVIIWVLIKLSVQDPQWRFQLDSFKVKPRAFSISNPSCESCVFLKFENEPELKVKTQNN